MSALTQSGVVVIGAGVAGLAAARHLRAHAIRTTLIEATSRIGGRAWTTYIGDDPFDHGATWLHDADRNPLAAFAPPGTLIDTDQHRRERITIAGRPLTSHEQAAYAAAWDTLELTVAPALQGPDTTLAAAMAPMSGNPWAPLLALWEGPIIAAADPDRLGLQDWWRNRLAGRNLVPPGGVGTYIARHLATETTLATPATCIAWGGQAVTVETPSGAIHAGAAIITVSTGVLAGSTLRFDPPLPSVVQTAIHGLPMGLLTKIALPATNRLGLEPGSVLADHAGCMTFSAWPLGRAHLMGFLGGSQAWALSTDPRALEDLARAELRRTLGADALRAIGPAAIITRWGTDPASAGAYAYAGPGNHGHRATLAAAFPGERLLFAGEATRSDGLAGTVGGAYLSGIDAATRLLATA